MGIIPGITDRLKTEINRFGFVDGIRYWKRQASIRSQNNVIGVNVYERDWDALILLDACRVDELKRQSCKFEFLSDFNQIPSVATHSPSWMSNTFANITPTELDNTAYITANPFSEEIPEVQKVEFLDHVWKYATDSSLNVVPPRPVTDRAIKLARSQSYDRLIIHYMQPHAPFIRQSDDDIETILEGNQSENDYGEGLGVWPAIYAGHVDLDEAIEAYRETLAFVLNDVALLLENLDAPDTVISADHGQLFGEQGIYGHPPDMPLPPLQNVPWVKTAASDLNTYSPKSYDRSVDDIGRDERLHALGYH
ncbi:hypothetical protein [Halohasta salina]|uniref:hypothetical protein n=1 Tax=Halohasta salina TaxID=2961621 RepID=UPI0020A57132|nr:hypothetical protein [Halohasta salina]